MRSRPAFAWVTATPHGSEPAAGEAISRQLYELAARTDCANLQRLNNLTLFLDPARNPDGRDATSRYTAWGFDPNRDFGTRNQPENRNFMPEINKYPGLFFIDAHQNTGSYFFPPNEDPVHHEISQFALDFIQYRIGPAIQQAMNDQSIAYRNYNTYDLFTPEYGDTVPALLMGSAGMTFEQPTGDAYGKQIYNHYLAIDTTINVTSRDKVNLLTNWVKQWQEAVDQGARCELQPNKLVSPLHTEITQQPTGNVCGYFYKPGLHSGDTAKLMRDLISSEVNVYRLDQPVTVDRRRRTSSGPRGPKTDTLPAGTLFIPMAQPQKHWIQAILGEDPFIPFPYFYDVVTWSYSLMRGMAGNGIVTKNLPSGTAMTKIERSAGADGARRRRARCTRSTRTRCRASAWRSTWRAPGATVYRADRGVRLRRPPLRHGRRHWSTGTSLAGSARQLRQGARPRHAGLRPAALRRPRARRSRSRRSRCGPVGQTIVPNPENGTHCTSASDYCWARFTLEQKDRIPRAQLVGLTTTQITNGELTNPATATPRSSSRSSTRWRRRNAIAPIVQQFVNNGGRFLSYYTGGTTSARNIGLTALNTQTLSPAITTPGSTYDGTFDTTNPVAWGFDKGGFIYRDASGNAVYNPATLAGRRLDSGGLGADPLQGRRQVLRLRGQLASAPASSTAVRRSSISRSAPGRAFLFASDPFFRAWHESVERQALNALIYPLGATSAGGHGREPHRRRSRPPRPRPRRGPSTWRPAAVAAPLAAKALPAIKSRPLATTTCRPTSDIRITVTRLDASALRKAVSQGEAPEEAAQADRVHYRARTGKFTLVIRGARKLGDEHDQNKWMSPAHAAAEGTYKVQPLFAQL